MRTSTKEKTVVLSIRVREPVYDRIALMAWEASRSIARQAGVILERAVADGDTTPGDGVD